MAATQVVLILGAGPRVGTSVAEKFADRGYKVVVTSRSGTGDVNEKGFLSLKADLSHPNSVATLFDTVKSKLNAVPSVVVYNAASLTPPPDPNSILSIPVDRVVTDLNINTVTAYAAAQQAVAAWATSPTETKKTFIYTGNIMNLTILPVPMFVNLGVGKAASAYWIGQADAAYSKAGYRFFYADQRQADGKNIGQALDGPAHGEFYVDLAAHPANVPWEATFVKEKGYMKFN